MVISSPVWGLRPLRAGRSRTSKVPKPTSCDLVALLQGVGDGVQGAVDSSLGVLLGQVSFIRNSGDQVQLSSWYYTSKVLYQQKAAAESSVPLGSLLSFLGCRRALW